MNDKMRDLADMTASEKRDLLASLLQDSSGPTVSNLSLEQQRLWFLHKLDPSVPWHVAAGLRITGEFDLAALQQAVSQVMQRHESLRSTFVEVNGQPLRGSAPVTGFPLSVVALGGGVLGAVVGWEGEWLGGGEAVGEVEFWRGWLGGLGSFDFPSDGVRPGVKSFRGVGCGVWCGEGFA